MTEDMIFYFLTVAMGLIVLLIVWSSYCSNRTLDQRTEMLAWACEVTGNEFWRRLAVIKSVSYDEHYRELLWMRDPLRLYAGYDNG